MPKHKHKRFTHKTPMEQRYRVDANGCWLYRGTLDTNGYGVWSIGGTKYAAHRIAYQLLVGRPVPEGMCLCHSCDVRQCINPAHLFVGTKQDNTNDMHLKGRWKHPGPTRKLMLDPVVVREMSKTMSRKDIATHFGCSKTAVDNAIRGHSPNSKAGHAAFGEIRYA